MTNPKETKEMRSLKLQRHFQLDKIYYAESNTALMEAKKALKEIELKIENLESKNK